MSKKGTEKTADYNAFRRMVVDALSESVEKFGKKRTCEIFEIKNRGTLDRWLAGGDIRPANMEKIYGIAAQLNWESSPIPSVGNRRLSTISLYEGVDSDKYVSYLVDNRYPQDGEFVYHQDKIGQVEIAQNRQHEIIWRRLDGETLIIPNEPLMVLLGTVRHFDDTYNPIVSPDAVPQWGGFVEKNADEKRGDTSQ